MGHVPPKTVVEFEISPGTAFDQGNRLVPDASYGIMSWEIADKDVTKLRETVSAEGSLLYSFLKCSLIVKNSGETFLLGNQNLSTSMTHPFGLLQEVALSSSGDALVTNHDNIVKTWDMTIGTP
ncbi:hypothetical protein AYL99_12072 [Fonsecaea erecta]|uniref:Uncharacterized protein n=1 Tax=Fonsecaea erecta TaxID=1367422 RepID=A0A178Z1S4_9EURO|nr:hypothetical protein AYL99_12072 [Fonsecaea erecta]OAP53748.1 hypothetical protein AYL99_12072 [Fonsecaea erecta]